MALRPQAGPIARNWATSWSGTGQGLDSGMPTSPYSRRCATPVTGGDVVCHGPDECDDHDPCTVDACDADGLCVHSAKCTGAGLSGPPPGPEVVARKLEIDSGYAAAVAIDAGATRPFVRRFDFTE